VSISALVGGLSGKREHLRSEPRSAPARATVHRVRRPRRGGDTIARSRVRRDRRMRGAAIRRARGRRDFVRPRRFRACFLRSRWGSGVRLTAASSTTLRSPTRIVITSPCARIRSLLRATVAVEPSQNQLPPRRVACAIVISRTDDSVGEGKHDQLCARLKVELQHDVRAMSVDRTNGDEQARRDLLVHVAEGEQMQDVALAL
jgi:hypothetical protein